jgi:hypothetical protein
MRLLLMGLMVGCFGVAGCGPNIRAMCEAEIACEGGNDLDIDACVAVEEVDADYLDEIGCSAEYNAYFACIEPYLKCNEQPTGGNCTMNGECPGGRCSGGQCVFAVYGPDPDDVDACEAEANAYGRCD